MVGSLQDFPNDHHHLVLVPLHIAPLHWIGLTCTASSKASVTKDIVASSMLSFNWLTLGETKLPWHEKAL